MTTITWLFLIAAVLLALAWYLSYTAARLDRLHAKVEGALSALDAHVVRRAEASLELVHSGALDPASAVLIAGAATESLERVNARRTSDDLLDGQHFAGREVIEGQLSEVLAAALPPDVVRDIRAGEGSGAEALERIRAAGLRVQLARRFHNDAVEEVRRVRAQPVVRLFRLAGHAALPSRVEFDDALPGG